MQARKAALHCAIGPVYSTMIRHTRVAGIHAFGVLGFTLVEKCGWTAIIKRQAKMCPPEQGMLGRVYQIDAGWMGGAASTGYGELLCVSGLGMFASTCIGVERVPPGSKFF
jgi:hypothetical protein